MDNALKVGFYSSIALTIITLVTFGFAMTAVPISGVFCPGNCIEYPYLDTLAQFPHDYIWMFFACFLIVTYLVYSTSVHSVSDEKRKVFSRIGLAFALISSSVLLICYFIQFSVVPASLKNGETEGIALLTQYNPRGIFIALEELGFIIMSFSFLFLSLSFSNSSRLEKFIKWIFIIAFTLTVISFVIISFQYGIERMSRFEVVVISIDWLVLMVNGVLSGIVFYKALKQETAVTIRSYDN